MNLDSRARRGRPPVPGRPIRVAHIIGCLDRGGAETVSLDLCRAIPASEVTQLFITLGGREGSLAEQFRAAGARIHRCPLAPGRTFAPRLWRCLRAQDPDVIVSHVSLASGPILLLARAAGVPVRAARMWSEGDQRGETPVRRARRLLNRRLLRYAATDVLGVTAAALAFAAPIPGDNRYRVLYNSVDPARVDGWTRDAARRRWRLPPDALVLAHLGRAAPEKNRPFLLDVHRTVRAHRPQARLLVAGAGGIDDLTSAYPGIVEDPTVLLAGEVDEVASILSAADVLLLPSRREGLPGVVLEALALGIPTVATDLACLREVARQVEGITLLPLSLGAERWAGAVIAQASTDGVRRREISKQLRSSPFLLDEAVRQWRALWQSGAR